LKNGALASNAKEPHPCQGGTLEMHCDYAVGAGSIISDNEIRRVLENGL
jgi:hypothetical protein